MAEVSFYSGVGDGQLVARIKVCRTNAVTSIIMRVLTANPLQATRLLNYWNPGQTREIPQSRNGRVRLVGSGSFPIFR